MVFLVDFNSLLDDVHGKLQIQIERMKIRLKGVNRLFALNLIATHFREPIDRISFNLRSLCYQIHLSSIHNSCSLILVGNITHFTCLGLVESRGFPVGLRGSFSILLEEESLTLNFRVQFLTFIWIFIFYPLYFVLTKSITLPFGSFIFFQHLNWQRQTYVLICI